MSDGKPLLINFRRYDKGLYAHAPVSPQVGIITCPLDKKYRRFTATIGVMHASGLVTFSVRVDGKPVVTSKELSGMDLAVPVDIDVSGATTLELCVDPGNSHACDWAVWGDPQLWW